MFHASLFMRFKSDFIDMKMTNDNKKKRKGSSSEEDSHNVIRAVRFKNDAGSIIRSHLSLGDCIKDVERENIGDSGGRVLGISTVPPYLGLSSLMKPTRGLKRKIGCIDVATQMGRENKIEDNYDMIKTIGKGKFGSVWLCRHKVSGEKFACKILLKGDEMVHREVEIMQHLSGHTGIVILKAVYEDLESYHLVMELCSGGRLVDQMMKEGRFSERRAACVVKELMLVVKYCHEMGVVHRDIKPENVLLTSTGQMKLADFGLAVRVADGQTLSGLAGSPAYVAPEVPSGGYDEKVDIWSVGVLLYALLAGVLPFKGNSLETLFDAIKNVELDFHSGVWESISKTARDLTERMLTRDASARITVNEVLEHPWIQFYVERDLKSFPIKPRQRNRVEFSPQVVDTPKIQQDRFTSRVGHPAPVKISGLSFSPPLPVASDSEEQDDYGLLDALTVAISQVRISEPKRSRLCGPISPIEQHCSSGSLCAAF